MRYSQSKHVLLAVMMVVIAGATAGAAATLVVERDGSGDFVAIPDAIGVAASGDTVLIGPGTYTETRPYDGGLSPTWYIAAAIVGIEDLTIVGAGEDQVIIDLATSGSSFDSPVGVTFSGNSLYISGVTFRNMATGISSGSQLHVENCRFENIARPLIVNGTDVAVHGATFADCSYAWFYGSGSAALLQNCVIDANVYCFNGVHVTVDNCTIGGSEYGVRAASGASVEIVASRISGVEEAVWVDGAGATIDLAGSKLQSLAGDVLRISGTGVIQGSGNDFVKGLLPSNWFARCDEYNASSPGGMNLEYNSWAVFGNDPFTLAEQIRSFVGCHPSVVLVDFEPFSGEPLPVDVRSFGSLKALYR